MQYIETGVESKRCQEQTETEKIAYGSLKHIEKVTQE